MSGIADTAILLTLARIGPLRIKNRIVMPPMTPRTAAGRGTAASRQYCGGDRKNGMGCPKIMQGNAGSAL